MTAADPIVPLADHELRAWRGMLRAHARVTQALDAEMRAQHDLSLSSYEVLWFLADAEGGRLRMADIATHALLSRSGLTRMVDRLVELGYVARVRADDDGRGSMAELTAAGRVALDAARRTHLDGVRTHFLDRLSADEQRRMGDAWDRVLE